MGNFYKKGRIIFFFIVFALLFLYIVVYYGITAFKKVPVFVQPKENVERGTIFDRNGKTLAVQTNIYNLGATPGVITDKKNVAALLAKPLGYTPEYLEQLLSSEGAFVYIKKKIEQHEYNEISEILKKNEIYGFRFDKIQGRSYPENALASQAIGFMGSDGIGLSGVEYTYDKVLSPQYKEGKDNRGNDVYLTIDANLQYKLEKIAQKALESTQAESLMLVAAQAQTGEILSYISLPSANLNFYSSSSVEEKKDLPAVSAYEPGSVFKLFSVASFIDSGAVRPGDTFVCDGIFDIRSKNGERVKISCLDHHGTLTAQGALQYSCNDVLAQMSEKIETEEFLRRIKSFGFGTKTGIELPGETKGSLKDTSSRLWSARSKPTISIGQEISVSALQMVQAATAFTNQGSPVKLTLISHINDKTGKTIYQHQVEKLPPVISAYTADYILSCMEVTAKRGTGTRALLPDISIGVKTGTAQMLDEKNGGYSKNDFVSNCLAIFPVEDPQIILYIVITKAKGENYAGRIVAPVIGEAADTIIDQLGISRKNAQSYDHPGVIEISREKELELNETVPDFTGLSTKALMPLLERNDINLVIEGSGWVIRQNPPAGTPIKKGMTIELFLE
ncbi:MAG: transpeptidase family protein [Treponemataceae bacterium]|nr:transpeptidase family protein [Treponemataceae bacterium]